MTPSNPRTEARAAASGAAAQVHDPAYAGTRTGDDATVAGLLRRLADDTTSLVTKEIALARAEVGRSVDSLKAAMAGMLVGAVVLICGLGVLLGAAVYALVEIADMQRWTAALLVGAVATVIGVILLSSAKSKLSAATMVPERTVQSLQKDQQMVRSKVS
ncbi:MAG: phage holin family protein [Limnobacter sp.]|nr:phage holin family protein [Limnobacter sp.]